MRPAGRPGPPGWRDDRGATSVVFALVAMLLLAIAALAVDLTNLYSQRTVAQGRADAAAFAAAQALPDACAAVDAARQSLLDTGGRRATGEAVPVVRVFGGGPAGGDPAAPPPPVASTRPDCSTAGASVQVTTPPRTVPFVFAGVLDLFEEGAGTGGTTVSAVARVGLAEPDLLPLWLPRGCLGDVFVVTAPAPEPDPVPDPGPEQSADPSPEPVPTPAPGCAAAQADAGLGVLDSPVSGGGTADTRLLANLRDGIDHPVEALDTADGSPDQRCTTGSPTGAVLDVPLPVGTPSCVLVRDLADPSLLREPLEQRLAAAPAFARCGSAPADAGAWATLAACYLLEGSDRDAVLAGSGPSLDESVLADPRFFVVPELVLDGPDTDGGFVPVLGLLGAFAVEGDLGPDGTLPAFVFPLEALPRMVVDAEAERPRTLVLTTPLPAPATGDGP